MEKFEGKINEFREKFEIKISQINLSNKETNEKSIK